MVNQNNVLKQHS